MGELLVLDLLEEELVEMSHQQRMYSIEVPGQQVVSLRVTPNGR